MDTISHSRASDEEFERHVAEFFNAQPAFEAPAGLICAAMSSIARAQRRAMRRNMYGAICVAIGTLAATLFIGYRLLQDLLQTGIYELVRTGATDFSFAVSNWNDGAQYALESLPFGTFALCLASLCAFLAAVTYMSASFSNFSIYAHNKFKMV